QASEERRAEPFLERAHLLADGCLRHVQFLRGTREAQGPRRCFSRAQRIQGKMRAHGSHKIFYCVRQIILDCRSAQKSGYFASFQTSKPERRIKTMKFRALSLLATAIFSF